MNIACALGIHKWSGCACLRCGTVSHQWDNCKCRKCGEIRGEHSWNGCKCTTCGKARDEGHTWNGCLCTSCHKILHTWNHCCCSRCGKQRDEEHEWQGPKCVKCGTIRPLSKDEFRIAIHSADMPLVRACVELAMGANANLAPHIRSQEFLSPLHMAAHIYSDSRFEEQKQRGLLEIAEYLLDHGADPNAQVWPGGDTPLHKVNYPKDTAFAELLFKHGADPSIKNYFTRTAAEECERRFENGPRYLGSSHVMTQEEVSFIEFLRTAKGDFPRAKEAPRRCDKKTVPASPPPVSGKQSPTSLSNQPPVVSEEPSRAVRPEPPAISELGRVMVQWIKSGDLSACIEQRDQLRETPNQLLSASPDRSAELNAFEIAQWGIAAKPDSPCAWLAYYTMIDDERYRAGSFSPTDRKRAISNALLELTRIAPSSAFVWSQQGSWLAYTTAPASPDIQKAVAAYQTALRIQPGFRPALHGLAQLHDRRGDSGNALGCYRELASLYPEEKLFRNAVRELGG
jgi:hypothetical protein